MVLQSAPLLSETLLVAGIETVPRRRRGWSAPKNRAVAEEYTRLIAQEFLEACPARHGS